MPLTDDNLLEAITESIRHRRRNGKFPVPLQVSYMVWHPAEKYIALDIFDEGRTRKFDIIVVEVQEHGEEDVVETNEQRD